MEVSLINPTNQRFYYMRIIQDLFGEYEIIICRGSNKRKGILKYLPFESITAAIKKFEKLIKLRLNRGYIKL